jgi:hypothetical protein
VAERAQLDAAAQLEALDTEVDGIAAIWIKSLLENLADASTRRSVGLLAPEQRALIDEFLRVGALPDLLTEAFIRAVQEALAGLTRIVVTATALLAMLDSGGGPMTVAELKRRFNEFADGLVGEWDESRVRVVIE